MRYMREHECGVPILRGLTRLSLAHLPRPSHEEFRQLCVQNPHLEYLKLEDVYPIMQQTQHDADREWGSFVLNSLRTLDIVLNLDAQDRVDYVERFFGALTVPVLCELSFQSEGQLAWEGFRNTICNGNFVWDHLRTFHLVPSRRVNFHHVADPVRLFRIFPKLEHFTFHPASEETMLSFLHTWIYNPTVPHTSPNEIWRKLKSLTIRMPEHGNGMADPKLIEDSLELLEGLRLWNDRYFKLYVW